MPHQQTNASEQPADQRRRAEGAIARLEAAEKNDVRKNLSNAGV
jgi:hypothetical protein